LYYSLNINILCNSPIFHFFFHQCLSLIGSTIDEGISFWAERLKSKDLLCGDVDGNGVVDIFDALMISEYDAGFVGSLKCGP